MRALLILIGVCAAVGTANAQYSGGYAPYSPGYQQAPPSYTAPPGSYTAQAGGSGHTLAQALLAPQNEVRAAVGDPPLRWSEHLAESARDWANHLLATGQFAHRPANPFGENLYEMLGGTATPDQVVDGWAEEARHYDIRSNTCSGVCGHYTQIVWRTTREVGCAVTGNANREVWVCEYDPPGNYVGYRPY